MQKYDLLIIYFFYNSCTITSFNSLFHVLTLYTIYREAGKFAHEQFAQKFDEFFLKNSNLT